MIKSILAAVAALAVAGAATAEGEFETEFTYDPTASVETTYDAFQSQAKRACRIDLRRAGSLGVKMAMEAACQEALMDNAVRATGNGVLIALHTGEPASPQTILVSEAE